jgi:DNA-binding XRE family transcriptional regulator
MLSACPRFCEGDNWYCVAGILYTRNSRNIPIWDILNLGLANAPRQWSYGVIRSIFTDDYKNLIGLLTDARKKAGVTQAELAGRLSQTQSYVSKYENSERRLDFAEVMEIARALNVRASELIYQIEEGAFK